MSPGGGIREPQASVCDEGPGQTAGELVSQQSAKETVSDCLMKYRGACNFTNVFDIKKQLPVYTFGILISSKNHLSWLWGSLQGLRASSAAKNMETLPYIPRVVL